MSRVKLKDKSYVIKSEDVWRNTITKGIESSPKNLNEKIVDAFKQAKNFIENFIKFLERSIENVFEYLINLNELFDEKVNKFSNLFFQKKDDATLRLLSD